MSEFSEGLPSQEAPVLHLESLQKAVELAKNPTFYDSEWRYLTDLKTQNPIARYIASIIGKEYQEINGKVPLSGSEEENNYVRGALVMARAFRTQSDKMRDPLPVITQEIIERHIQILTEGILDPAPETRHAIIKENARRYLVNDNIKFAFALNKLTDGKANLDYSYGAADVYRLMKLASQSGEKDPAYEFLYGTQRPVPVVERQASPTVHDGFNEFLLDGALQISDAIRDECERLGIAGTPVFQIEGSGGRQKWLLIKPPDSRDEDLLLQAILIKYSRTGKIKKRDPISLYKGMSGLLLTFSDPNGNDSSFMVSVDKDNRGHVEEIVHNNPPSKYTPRHAKEK